MHPLSTPRHPTSRPAATGRLGLASHFLFWLAALDSGYRSAPEPAHATGEHLSDRDGTRSDS